MECVRNISMRSMQIMIESNAKIISINSGVAFNSYGSLISKTPAKTELNIFFIHMCKAGKMNKS